MEKKLEKTKSPIVLGGYALSELMGILLMCVPVAISIFWRHEKNIFEKIWAFVSKQDTYYSIAPRGVMPLIACLLFLALVIRYDFIKRGGFWAPFISAIKSFLDIWALSSFLMIFFPQRSKSDIELMLLVVLFSWLGIKSIAGFGWIILIISGIGNASKILNMLGNLWPVFIITMTISLVLQVRNVANIGNFWQEFSGKALKVREIAGEDMSEAMASAGSAVKKVGKLAMQTDLAHDVGDHFKKDE